MFDEDTHKLPLPKQLEHISYNILLEGCVTLPMIGLLLKNIFPKAEFLLLMAWVLTEGLFRKPINLGRPILQI